MIIQGQVQQPLPLSATDGNNYPFLQGKQMEMIVSELHGKYYTQTARGNLFIGPIATASAIPITSTTAPTMILWNPTGSGKNAILVRYTAGWAATTEAPGNIQLAFVTGVGANIATGAPITAFTTVTPFNGLLGSGTVSSMKFGSAATLTAATSFIPLGLSHLTTTGTATFGSFTYLVDFDGMIIVPPGVAIFDVASTATASTYSRGLAWVEAPV